MNKTPPRGISTVGVHATLAALGLLLAFTTWTRDRAQVQQDTVVALDFNKRDVGPMTYEDETRSIRVERRSNDSGEYAWVTVTTRSKQLMTNPTPAPTAAPAPVGPAMDPHGHGAPPPPPVGAQTGAVTPAKPAPAPAAPGAPKPAMGQKGGDKAIVESVGGKGGQGPGPGQPVPPLPPVASPGTAPGNAPAAPTPGAAPIHEVKDTVTTKSFRGNDQAEKLFEQFGPLRVVRALGTVDDKKAKELGLDVSKKSLTVVAKGQTYKYTLGQNSYGAGDVYARDAQGQVFLLSHRLISDFEFAESRLMERKLHRFERSEFDRIEVEVMTASGPKRRTLVQKNRQDNANYYFADGSSPDKRDDSLKNWVDKILRMAINDYVAQGEEPKAGAPVAGGPMPGEVLTLRFFEGSKPRGTAVFSRYPTAMPSIVGAGPKPPTQMDYYARTETTVGLVRLLAVTAESAVQDAEKW